MTYEDILFQISDGIAHITINRPQVMNAFRGRTCEELIDAFIRAGWDKSVGVIVWAAPATKLSVPVATNRRMKVSMTAAAS